MESFDVIVGERDGWGGRQPFGLSGGDRRRHLYIIGQTGTGKSTLLRELLCQDIEAGQGCALIDPHGDLADELIDLVPPRRTDDVVIIDPSDQGYPVAINPFYRVPKDERALVAANLVATFKHLWRDSWGARLEYILYNAIAAVLDAPDNLRPTLLSVPRLLVDERYRDAVVRRVADPRVRAFFDDEFSRWNERFLAEALSPVQNKIGQFLANPSIRNILGQWRPTIDLAEIMEGCRILIVRLSKGTLGEEPANLLGSLITSGFQSAAMRRAGVPKGERTDFHFYIDEFHNFTTDAFASLLSEARKYGLTLTLGHQYLDQLGDEVRSAVFGNVGSVVAFRVGAGDALSISEEIGAYAPATFRDLARGRVCVRLLSDGESSSPFLGATLAPQRAGNGGAGNIRMQCRMRYCRSRKVVEGRVRHWLLGKTKKPR